MEQNNKTVSMLQRLPKILAVTAGSYGLSFQPGAEGSDPRRHQQRQAARPARAHRAKSGAQR